MFISGLPAHLLLTREWPGFVLWSCLRPVPGLCCTAHSSQELTGPQGCFWIRLFELTHQALDSQGHHLQHPRQLCSLWGRSTTKSGSSMSLRGGDSCCIWFPSASCPFWSVNSAEMWLLCVAFPKMFSHKHSVKDSCSLPVITPCPLQGQVAHCWLTLLSITWRIRGPQGLLWLEFL